VNAPVAGRGNQRLRTRKDLLVAAARLVKAGRTPTLDEVAEEALVSRATAYRYFPNIEALLVEAALDVEFPDPATVFAKAPSDPVERLRLADTAVEKMIDANEAALRAMIAHSVKQAGGAEAHTSRVRQNRRTPLIEAALATVKDTMDPVSYNDLVSALALIIGTEAMIVFKDVLGADDRAARRVRRWAIEALFESAKKRSHR
jgi:AcrR family transcriptional regulator